MTPERIRNRKIGFAFYLVAAIAYLAWRVGFSLNPEAPIYSTAFLLLEAYAIACSATFYLVTLEIRPPVIKPAPPGMRVDVFICTYNEDVKLLRQTIRRALAIEYPHKTWVLDDGRRPEVRALAEALGAGYITREKNTHYKAGNLNHALSRSDADFILVLDADHLVRPNFLDRVLGHFEDPRVAIVQTPQVYYNLDSFQHHFRAANGSLWHEGAIFHHAMQPGADRWNAAFFVGTGAVLRRSALEKIGGFATESVTEDAFTCMRLHAAGFRSVYHDEPLGYLLAPESLLQYLTQRLRWGQGSLQILRIENPLTRPGLSWQQRIVYFSALSSFAQAIVHLAYYLAPAIFLLGGPAPLRAQTLVDFIPLALHIVIDIVAFKLWLGPLARPLLAECYKFLNYYVFLKSLTGYFKKGRLKFQVTTKGRDSGVSLSLLAPQVALLLLNVLALGFGMLRLHNGNLSTVGMLGTGVAVAFAGLFVLVGGMTLLFARNRIAASADTTFPDAISAEITHSGSAHIPAIVARANETQLHAIVPFKTSIAGENVALQLDLEDGKPSIESQARVESVDFTMSDESVLTLVIEPLSIEAQDRLFDRFCLRAMPRVIDPLVLAWTGRRPENEQDASMSYYLPVQTQVV